MEIFGMKPKFNPWLGGFNATVPGQVGMNLMDPKPQPQLPGPPSQYPGYIPTYDPSFAALPQIQGLLSGINMDQRGLDKFRGEALRDGPSNWAKLKEEQLKLDERTGIDRAVKEAAASTANQRSQLAMRGGLTSGARERIAQSATPNLIAMTQQQRLEGQKNRLGISAEDEQNRVRQLGALPGMEVQALEPQFKKAEAQGRAFALDTGNMMRDREARNQYNMNLYNKQMETWGANRTAQATERSGKK